MANPMDVANAAASYAQDAYGQPKRPCPTCGAIQAGMDQEVPPEVLQKVSQDKAAEQAAEASRQQRLSTVQQKKGTEDYFNGK